MTVGARIKATRVAVGMTQNEVGKLCDIDAANIRKYESGRQNPKIETVQKIAEALGIPVELLTGDQPFPDPFLENDDFGRMVHWAINAHFDKEIFNSEMSFAAMVNIIYNLVAELHFDGERHSIEVIYKSNKLDGYEETKPDKNLERISSAYLLLNEAGQQKAVERVEELTEIPKYQKKPGGE